MCVVTSASAPTSALEYAPESPSGSAESAPAPAREGALALALALAVAFALASSSPRNASEDAITLRIQCVSVVSKETLERAKMG